MKGCQRWSEQISAYIDNELNSEQKVLLEEHLAICETCRAELADCRKARSKLLSLQESVPVRDITEATLVKIKSLQGPHSDFKSWGRRALLLAPLVVVLITLLVFHPWGGVPGPSIVIA